MIYWSQFNYKITWNNIESHITIRFYSGTKRNSSTFENRFNWSFAHPTRVILFLSSSRRRRKQQAASGSSFFCSLLFSTRQTFNEGTRRKMFSYSNSSCKDKNGKSERKVEENESTFWHKWSLSAFFVPLCMWWWWCCSLQNQYYIVSSSLLCSALYSTQ